MTENKNQKKPEIIKRLIIDDICQDKYKIGEALPSGRDMAKMYGVSSFVIREALSNLCEAGIIAIEQGKSTRVVSIPVPNVFLMLTSGFYFTSSAFWDDFVDGIKDFFDDKKDCRLEIRTDQPGSSQRVCCNPINYKGIFMIGKKTNHISIDKDPKCPLIEVFDYSIDEHAPYISCDFDPAMAELAQKLSAYPDRRIAYLSCFSSKHSINIIKRDSFLKNFGKYFADQITVTESSSLLDEIYEQTRQLLSQKRPPNVLIISSETLAPGVYRAIGERKLRVPEEIILIGCDNLHSSNFLLPSLTAISFDRREIGRRCAQTLYQAVQNGTPVDCRLKLPSSVVYRESFPSNKN